MQIRWLAGRLALGGAAMKLGQLLSPEAGDLLPPEVAEALATLRDASHAMPPEQLRRVLREAWGRDWEQRFQSFDFQPIGAASIGQVRAAVARSLRSPDPDRDRAHRGRIPSVRIDGPGPIGPR